MLTKTSRPVKTIMPASTTITKAGKLNHRKHDSYNNYINAVDNHEINDYNQDVNDDNDADYRAFIVDYVNRTTNTMSKPTGTIIMYNILSAIPRTRHEGIL